MTIGAVLERAGLGSVRKEQPLPLRPAGSITISNGVDLVENDEGGVVFLHGMATWCWGSDDVISRRLAAVSLLEVGAATQMEVAGAFDMHDATLRRWRDEWKTNGTRGLAGEQLGPKRKSKLTEEVVANILALREGGMAIADVAVHEGISERSVKYGLSGCKVHTPAHKSAEPETPSSELVALAQPQPRREERQAARCGEITDAAPVITQGISQPLGGALTILPSLQATGLLEVFNSTYTTSRAAFYGLRSLVLAICFSALLGCSRSEAAGRISPCDLGRLLGLDRGPETKTIRRRTEELASLGLSDQLGVGLAKRHVECLGEDGGVFYLDGHVRAYHGTARIPMAHVGRLDRAMMGEEDAWLCDEQGRGVLVWSSPPGSGLTTELRRATVEIRALVGDDATPTIIFDRGGWSPKTFAEITEAGFDICTYRKAPLPKEPRSAFVKHHFIDDLGRSQDYWLSDRKVRINYKEGRRQRYFSCRQVTRLDVESGHQTQVLTTRFDDEPTAIAHKMFSRWRQENFFRYMRAHYDIDGLDSYAKTPDDPERQVVNPKRKAANKALKQARTVLQHTEAEQGRALLDGHRDDKSGNVAAIEKARAEVERLKMKAKAAPTKIRLGDVRSDAMRLNVERKRIFDAIRMATYNAESVLARLLGPHFVRAEHEARTLLGEVFARSADMVVDNGEFQVRIDPLSAPRRTQALVGLCEELTATKTIYPGTDLVLVYSVKGPFAG